MSLSCNNSHTILVSILAWNDSLGTFLIDTYFQKIITMVWLFHGLLTHQINPFEIIFSGDAWRPKSLNIMYRLVTNWKILFIVKWQCRETIIYLAKLAGAVESADCISVKGTPTATSILDMTCNCIWWWSFTSYVS